MSAFLKQIFPFDVVHRLNDDETVREFEKWDQPARYTHIKITAFLTAILYLIFNVLEKPWISDDLASVILKLHVFINVPIILLMSYMAFKKVKLSILMPSLAATPVITSLVHVYISSQLEDNTLFMAEGYFVIFWIFVVSGMTLKYALISSSIISLVLITAGAYILTDPDVYLMYLFWILCSFTFGFLSAWILDRSRKSVFITQKKLQKLAITDTLTGVYNRSVLHHVLTQQLSNPSNSDHSFGLIIIDVDHFKSINDTLGHEVGDQVIKKIAKKLSQLISEKDTLVRWGGEEFVVIATQVDSKSLAQQCNEIRIEIENDRFLENKTVTVSIGATLYRDKDTHDSLLIRADNAMYQAKEEGRNRFVIIK